MKTIICNTGNAYENSELSNYMDENNIEDVLDFFGGDDDIIRVDNENIAFTCLEVDDNTKIILYIDDDWEYEKTNLIETMLKDFFSSNFKKYFEEKESDWSEFKNNSIAYRGGRGYTYSIWHYKKNVKQSKVTEKDLLHGILFGSSLDGVSKSAVAEFRKELLEDLKVFLTSKTPAYESNYGFAYVRKKDGKIFRGCYNYDTLRPYHRYENVVKLTSTESIFFVTMSSLNKRGIKLPSGVFPASIVSFLPQATDNEKVKFIPIYSSVIPVEKIPELSEKKGFEKIFFTGAQQIQYVENFLNAVVKRMPTVKPSKSNLCYYSKNEDIIKIVKIDNFKNSVDYYSVLFHELIHSTGHNTRTKRFSKYIGVEREELVAEIGAMLLCRTLGLTYNKNNNLTYLKSWMTGRKKVSDKGLLEAFEMAVEAVDYIIGDVDIDKLIPQPAIDKAVKVGANGQTRMFDGTESKTDKSCLKFNEYLQKVIKNNQFRVIIPLGKPVNKLSKFLSNNNIYLSGAVLKKAEKKHNIILSDLYNLPDLLANPIAIFDSKIENSKIIMIAKKCQKGLPIIVAIRAEKNSKKIVINDIKSIHGRELKSLSNWIEENLLLYPKKIKNINDLIFEPHYNCEEREKIIDISDTKVQRKNDNTKKGLGEIDNIVENQDVKILSAAELAKTDFEILELDKPFKTVIGTPSKNFAIMVSGPAGNGKTTWCIQFAKYLSENKNLKVLFATIEEGHNFTFKEKLTRLGVNSENLLIATGLPKDLSPYDVIFIDSVNTFGFSPKDLQEFRKNNPTKSFVYIFQYTKNGLFKGSSEFAHDVDVVLTAESGVISSIGNKNRFGGAGEMKVF